MIELSGKFSKELRLAGKALAKKFGASRVILFGSHAYGRPDTDSDVDICVILDLSGKRKIEVLREIRRELSDIVSSPLDILVYSKSEFDERANVPSTLEHKILTQGINIYEQSGRSAGVV